MIDSEFQRGRMEATLERIELEIKDIKEKLDSKYVTQEEFKPVKTIAYSAVGLILTTVVLALLALVIKQ